MVWYSHLFQNFPQFLVIHILKGFGMVKKYRRVMVERSDRMWSTGEGNGKPLQYSCLEYPMNSMKRQNDRIPKEELPRSLGAQLLLEISGEITPERMKGWSQNKTNTQLWM